MKEVYINAMLLAVPFCLNFLLPRIIKKMRTKSQSVLSLRWIKGIVFSFVVGCSFGGFLTMNELEQAIRFENSHSVFPTLLCVVLLIIGCYPIFTLNHVKK